MRTIRKVVRSKAFRIVVLMALLFGLASSISVAPASATTTKQSSTAAPESIKYGPGRDERLAANCDAHIEKVSSRVVGHLNGKPCIKAGEKLMMLAFIGNSNVKYPQGGVGYQSAVNGASFPIPTGCVFVQVDFYPEGNFMEMVKKDKQGNPVKDSKGNFVFTLTKENDRNAIAWLTLPCASTPPSTQPPATVPPTTQPPATVPPVSQPPAPKPPVQPVADTMATDDAPVPTTSAPAQVASTQLISRPNPVQPQLAETGAGMVVKIGVPLGTLLIILGIVATKQAKKRKAQRLSA